MAIPHVVAGEVALASEQNALIDQVNMNTTDIGTNASDIGTLMNKYFGQWSDVGGEVGGRTINDSSGERMTDIDVQMETPNGCSLSTGAFTPDVAGLWLFTYSMQTIGGTANTGSRAMFLAKGTADLWGGTGARYGLTAAHETATALCTSTMIRLSAGEAVTAYLANWGGGTTDVWMDKGNILTAVWLFP